MAIIHVDGTNDRIEVDGALLRVLPFGNCAGGEFDLTEHQGSRVRLYLDEDGALSLDQSRAHWWQLAEVALPPPEYEERDTGETGEDGQAIIEQVQLPLDLTALNIYAWALPEVG
jgi:hypothetical protein